MNNQVNTGHPSLELLFVSPDTEYGVALHTGLNKAYGSRFHVEQAKSIDAGLEKLPGRHFGAVLIDVAGVMPELHEAVAAIRSLVTAVPIVALTDTTAKLTDTGLVESDGVYRISKASLDSELFLLLVRCIVERGKMLPHLRASEERCHTFLQQSTDAILIVSPERSVRFANDEARFLLGMELEHASEDTFSFPLEDGNVTEVSIPQENGEAMVAEMMTGSISWEGAPAFLVTMRDITKRKKADELARQRALELQARNEELDAFSHMVAHDLRNPLGVISGFVEMLEEDCGRMPEEQMRSLLQAIGHATSKMHNIVEGLLLLAGVRKKHTVQTETLDMGAITQEAQQRLLHLADEYDATVVRADAWPPAVGYGPWIEEVWVNYLSNAIKHGGDPPHIEMGATALENGQVRFWVRDNGPGIPEKEQEKLFTPFTRLSQVRSKGYGLGLSIVQRIVERLGGQVGVESKIGDGSTFYFTLPEAK